MASIDTTRTFAAHGGNSVSGVIVRFFDAIQSWNDARITRRSLSRLTERELDDIGLCRGDIEQIVARGQRF